MLLETYRLQGTSLNHAVAATDRRVVGSSPTRGASLLSGIARQPPRAEALGVGDGKTFGQALRALDKFIAEQSRADDAPTRARRSASRTSGS